MRNGDTVRHVTEGWTGHVAHVFPTKPHEIVMVEYELDGQMYVDNFYHPGYLTEVK